MTTTDHCCICSPGCQCAPVQLCTAHGGQPATRRRATADCGRCGALIEFVAEEPDAYWRHTGPIPGDPHGARP